MKSLALASAIAALAAQALFAPSCAKAQTDPDNGYVRGYAYVPAPDYYGRRGYGYATPSYPVAVYRPRIPAAYDPEQPSRSGWRRGQHLPSDFRGEVVGDYASHHLRRPPRGCLWYRDADDYILASTTTGLIFEVIHDD
jgi:Ni/Co efflux regulator RcnB